MLVTLRAGEPQQVVWAAGRERQGALAVRSWLIANRDQTNQIRVGPAMNDRQAPDLASAQRAYSIVDPLGSISVAPDLDWYALSPNAAVQADIIPDCNYWAPSPAQAAAQIATLGLMLDATGQAISSSTSSTATSSASTATNTSNTAAHTATALTAGVPPGVPSITSAHQLFGVPAGSPYTLVTFAGAGRLWAVSLSFALSSGSTFTAGTSQSAAAYMALGSGPVLEVVELNLSNTNQVDSGHGDIALNGLPVANGDTVVLNVNGGVAITGAQMRCSANVLYSIP